ncbi:MAG: phosphotransferase family protein [Acidimicrobiia bacterium]|nr:phosphotransferase family protein [Acidimicrobiia bacterium]
MPQTAPPDEERVQAYFRHRMPEAADLRVTNLHRNVGGMSRETWFADLQWVEDGATREESYIIRADHPDGSVVPHPLEREFKIHAALQHTDLPVARPYWYEEDVSWIGRAPFYVREALEGTSAPKELYAPGKEERRRRIGRQLAELLARVHTCDWEAAGFGSFMAVPETAEDCALLELSFWEQVFRADRPEAKPVMAELFSWLRRNAPRDVERVSLVWGDVGVGNFIYRDDEIVGLTDWEQGHLGDAMKDIAFALWRGLDHLIPREELFEVYEAAGGPKIDQERIHYYTVFINAENCSTSDHALKGFLQGRNADITMARLTLGFPWQCQDQGLREIGYG